jgi:hypothetical protein
MTWEQLDMVTILERYFFRPRLPRFDNFIYMNYYKTYVVTKLKSKKHLRF